MDIDNPAVAPLLSVVVPAHRVEEHLEDCVAGILRQLVDLEILLIVDPSPDRTADVARALAARHPNVRVLENPRKVGPGATRNAGLHVARGTYVAFPDSDDLVAEGAYRTVLDVLEETGSDFATSRADEFGRAPGRRPYWTLDAEVFETGARRTTLAEHPELVRDHTAWTKVFRRAFLLEHDIRWPEGVLCEDVVPSVRAYSTARAIDVVPRCTYLYRRRAGSITTRLNSQETLQDWSVQTLAAMEVLEEVGHFAALQEMIEKLLRHEVPGRLAAAAVAHDKAAGEAVRACVHEVRRRAVQTTLDRLPAPPTSRSSQPSLRLVEPSAVPPLLSVIVPTHDVAPWIDECLQSLLDQDHPALEVIVVDDASQDGTWEIIQEYAAQDSRLIAMRSPARGGGAARNAGAAMSRGDFLIFADGDDVVPLRAYSRLVGAAQRHGADLVVGGFLKFWATGAWSATGYGLEEYRASTTLLDHPALIRNRTCWNKLVRRDLWDRVAPLFPDVPRANDIVPVTRLLTGAERIAVLPDIVYEYRTRPGGSSMTASLGTALSTVSHLRQELECAAALHPWSRTRLGHEHGVSMLAGDLWTALDRLAPTMDELLPQERAEVVSLIGQLLDTVPRTARRAIGPRRLLGIQAAARGHLDRLRVFQTLDQARTAGESTRRGSTSPHAADARKRRRQVITAAEALLDSARADADRAALITVLQEDVIAAVGAAPSEWDPAVARQDLAELAGALQGLGEIHDLSEATTPGTREPRLLATILRADSLSQDQLGLELTGQFQPIPGTLIAHRGELITLHGEGRAPRRLLARAISHNAQETRALPAAISDAEAGWRAEVDLSGLPVGSDHAVLALLDDELGEKTVPLSLSAEIRPGRFDRLRLSGAPGAHSLRTLESGSARAERALRWRLARVRRAANRRLTTGKER